MSLLNELSKKEVWERFYEYKTSLACPKDITGRLRDFIDGEEYLPVCECIDRNERFALPARSVISKQSSQKKRTVYTYPYAENTVLKLLTYLMLRKYDGIYSENLFSFRPGKTAQDAVRMLLRDPLIFKKYSYKVDVSDYFNSIPIDRLLPDLKEVLKDDMRLFEFLKGLLEEKYVTQRGCKEKILFENKGIMAGTPIASFYADLYLKELDRSFYDRHITYARYSDDIIVFANTKQEISEYADEIKNFLYNKELMVNPSKESFCEPSQPFVFLGFSLREGIIDIAPASVTKLKQKMRRKTRALMRWRKRNALEGEKAAKAFIRVFNRKLFESSKDSDLSWAYWYFSMINTTESLHEIDLYAQDCIRYLISGTHTKSRYNILYDDMKKMGYRTLVNAYYG